MPEIVNSLQANITASADEAVNALEKTKDAMADVKTETKATAKATEEAGEKFEGTAAEVRKLAAELKKMGLDDAAAQARNLAKSLALEDNMKAVQKQAAGIADALDKKGNYVAADTASMFGDPEGLNAQIQEEIALAKEAAKERADIARWEAKNETAEQQRYKRIAAESERAYTELMKQAAKERAAVAAAEAAAKAAAEKQANREAMIGARELAKAQAAASREAARIAREEARAKAQTEREAARAAKEAAKAEAAASREAAREARAAVAEKAKAEKEAQKEAAKAAKETERRLADAQKAVKGFGAAFANPLAKIKNLIASVKRIAFYRLIRTAIKGVTSAVKEGLTNLEAYSKIVGTAFTPAVENLRNHVLMLKNAFATALRPIIEALIPVIIRLCDWLARAADFLAQVFSVLFGKTDANGRYTKAVLTDLKESNAEAKKLKKEMRSLLGFDEINRLDDNSDSGTPASSTTDPGVMFEQAEVSEKAKEWAEKLQKVWDIIKGIVGTVTQFIKDNPWVLKLAGIILAVVAAVQLWNKYIKPVLTIIGSVVSKVGLVKLAVAGAIIAFALFGDKIKAWCDKAKKKVDEFFNRFKKNHPKLAKVIGVVQDIIDFALDSVGLLADAIYNFVHGDFAAGIADILAIGQKFKDMLDGWKTKGDSVFNDLLGLIGDIVVGITECVGTIAGIINALINGDMEEAKRLALLLVFQLLDLIITGIYGLANLILGVLESIVYNVELAAQWVWNKIIVPVVNKVATFFAKGGVWLHNAGLDIRIGILKVVQFILEKINDLLAKVSDKVNKWIEWSNKNLGTNFKPVDFKIDTEKIDDKIQELENKKLPPITEEVQVLSEWKEVTRPDFKLDVNDAKNKLWALYDLATKTSKAVGQINVVTARNHGVINDENQRLTYASGGYPSIGSIFIAGEAGAEWVGDIGGKTGVMNTDQMAQAMYNAMNAALANNPQGGGDIYLDGEVIYRNTVRRNNNRVRATGRSALLT